jgi:hypothetical protein
VTGVERCCVESPYAFTPREAQAIDEIVELTVERDSFRLLAQQAIHALHRAALEGAQLRKRHLLLLSELRHLRRGKRNSR